MGTCAYDHTTLNTPVLVWSLKLSSVGLVQYLDGWLPRNHRLCLFMFSCFILFLFFWGAFFDFVLFVFFFCIRLLAMFFGGQHDGWISCSPIFKVGCDLLLLHTGFYFDLLTECSNKVSSYTQSTSGQCCSDTPQWSLSTVECAPCSVHNYELHEKIGNQFNQFIYFFYGRYSSGCIESTTQPCPTPLREGVEGEGDINSSERLGHYLLQR